MTQRQIHFVRPVRILTLAIVPGSFCLAAPAIAETVVGVNVSVSGKASTNPYLAAVAQSGVAGEVQIDPWLQFLAESSSIELRGSFSGSAYTGGNGTDRTARVDLSAQRDLSPHFKIRGGAAYSNSNAGAQNYLLRQVGPVDNLPSPVTPPTDTSFAGIRTKVQSFDAHLGLGWIPSALDTLNVDFGAVRARSDSDLGADYDSYSASLGYARKLSAYTSATADVAVTKSDYKRSPVGDGTIITPRVGLRRQFSRSFTANVNIGASFSRTRRLNGEFDKFTTLSGSVQLCNKSDRSVLCLNASRSAEPRAIGGITPVTSADLSFDRQLSLRDSLTLTARYSRNDSSIEQRGAALQFYGASGTLTHRFNQRFVAFASPSYTRSTDDVQPNRDNLQMSIGLRYSFGGRS